MATTARGKPVALSGTISWRVPNRVEGDPIRLRQVLVNLLHNAVKFTERGRIVLDVGVLGATEDAVQLRFEVRDTGIGIAEDQFDSVFDAFTQVDASSTRRHGGTGLGLAIVKEIAELMGGRVGVDSRIAHGSTFWLELSLKRAADPARRLRLRMQAMPSRRRTQAMSLRPSPRCARGGETDDGVSSAHILLVEDDAVNQMVLAAMLEQLGCRVDIVDDGEAACERGGAHALRHGVHGLPHALDGRLRSHAPHPRRGSPYRRHAHADRRPDGARARRRPRALPRLGDGRLHDQAGSRGAARGGGAALGRRQARPLTLRDPARGCGPCPCAIAARRSKA